ncbi:hypothetical protein EMIHUDRAFT_243183 [Emiliania huxleyi CCMP1516]|uniref:Uncharacterized protein n=2 Tax=Emiliania huxleyi TaxID=2903 RepID=A0A0D3J6P6_EMIH1|nr:hypothetical protein EMIHUDRAFT_243183 [Emiliania huxleyi CCMP1516]EOD19181.1 hypothetical protein EMIHUDRAFT_243183 [Emiliania huxleyi CCMP1516]|eukprot:XP_005771610.1 hypothetical protein EMIHUDRAFT_243183 [Emiliania huxleyi CCMP1516]
MKVRSAARAKSAGREGICRRSSAKVAPEWRTGGCIFKRPEAVYRPAAAVYRSAAEKGVDESTAVYQVYR